MDSDRFVCLVPSRLLVLPFWSISFSYVSINTSNEIIVGQNSRVIFLILYSTADGFVLFWFDSLRKIKSFPLLRAPVRFFNEWVVLPSFCFVCTHERVFPLLCFVSLLVLQIVWALGFKSFVCRRFKLFALFVCLTRLLTNCLLGLFVWSACFQIVFLVCWTCSLAHELLLCLFDSLAH